jgi:hypothetical protein
VHELLGVLAEPTAEMQTLRAVLAEQGRFPCRRTFVPSILFWRAFLLHHTRRLLPALVGTAHARAYRRFAEDLVRAVYLEDGDAIARHGCDPATCTHEAHVRD